MGLMMLKLKFNMKKVFFLIFSLFFSCNAKPGFSSGMQSQVNKLSQKLGINPVCLAFAGGVITTLTSLATFLGVAVWSLNRYQKKQDILRMQRHIPVKCTACPTLDKNVQFEASQSPITASILRGEDSFLFYIKPKNSEVTNEELDLASKTVRAFVKDSNNAIFNYLDKGRSANFKKRFEEEMKKELKGNCNLEKIDIDFCGVE